MAGERESVRRRQLYDFLSSQDDDGTYYGPGEIGFFDPANPVPAMTAYRAAEARCDPADLPWTVPEDLGQIQRDVRPGYTTYDLHEGVPEEFLDALDEESDA